MPIVIQSRNNTESIQLENWLGVNHKDKTVLVRIPAGEFEMGDGTEKNCPTHRVHLSEYWIGIYCVTKRQFAKFIEDTNHCFSRGGQWQIQGLPDHPVKNVPWDDCAAYAQWAGLSLPTEEQWEKAAKGPHGFTYPWGNQWNWSKCRNHKNRGQGDGLAAVYSYPEGSSGYGTIQQSGNVWEMCARQQAFQKKEIQSPYYRGGSWYDVVIANFRSAARFDTPPNNYSFCHGFRVARNIPKDR